MKVMEYRLSLQRVATLLAVVTLTLVMLAGITGILLAFYYEPTAGGAYRSLRFIAELIPNGGLVRGLHDIAGNGLIVMALLQLLVLFLGRQLRFSWFAAWISGFALAALAIALGWTAIILDWSQIGYWRFKVELGIIQTIPVIGSGLSHFLTGGNGISSLTVQHLYTLHAYVLSGIAIALAAIHLGTLIYQASNQLKEPQPVLQQLDATMSQATSTSTLDSGTT